LGVKRTQEYILQHVFGLDFNSVASVPDFLVWLSKMSRQRETIPTHLRMVLIEELRSILAYSDWPLDELLQSPHAFSKFLNTQWATFLGQKTRQGISEPTAPYLIDFEKNVAVQDLLPGWARTGVLAPVDIQATEALPDWAQVGLIESDVDPRYQRYKDLLISLDSRLAVDLASARWIDWNTLAWDWAELCTLQFSDDLELSDENRRAYKRIQIQIDEGFYRWLPISAVVKSNIKTGQKRWGSAKRHG